MLWEVEYTNEFGQWFESLDERDQDELIARVQLLEEAGPGLGRPVVDRIEHSRHAHMKELRAPRGIRVLFAFDPRRVAILLIGGDKSPDDPSSPIWKRWYDRYVPMADDLYDVHLDELRAEGLI